MRNTKSTTQKVRSLSLSGQIGSDLATRSVACCRQCCSSLVPILLMSCSCIACCCHYCFSLVPVSLIYYSGLVLFCVDFPCYCVANSYTVLYLSRCCFLKYFFHQIPFFLFAARKSIITAIMWKCFFTKCTLTLRMYPLRTRNLKSTSSHYQQKPT